MTRSLGRTWPSRRLIRIAQWIQSEPNLLKEVLCHELAHVAAYELYGPDIRPHGPEWRRLVAESGYTPRASLKLPRKLQQKSGHRIRRFRHHCPVCNASRVAGRRMNRWRCARCHDQGLSGLLEIEAL